MRKREARQLNRRYMKRGIGSREIEREEGIDKKAIERSTMPFSMALLALHFSFVLWGRD